MSKARYIAVEGPIGVGKTSLAKQLAVEFNGSVLLEEVEANPFLATFYNDRKKNAFKTQLFFLLSRYQQQRTLAQQDLFKTIVVSDYLFAKDRLFAYITLDEDELGLYERIYNLIDPAVQKPDLTIYLQASTEIIFERIKKRDKEYESSIEEKYIEQVVNAYNRYFFYYTDSPLLVVNTTEIDFVSSQTDLSDLIREIRSMKGGVQHYIPLGFRD